MLEKKKTVAEVKNVFDGLINDLNTAEERLSELEDVTTQIPKLKSKEEKKTEKTRTECQRTVRQL